MTVRERGPAAPLLARTLPALALLFAVALAPRIVAWALAAAPARDAVKFVRAAETLRTLPLDAAVRQLDVHPLYPAALLGAYSAAEALGLGGPWGWVQAGRGLGVATHLAFLAMAYWCGRMLWSPRIAWWGCALTTLLPRQVWYSIDVLSDNLHGAWWMAAAALLTRGWQRPSPAWFAAAGVPAACAYLTRPEGLLLPLALLGAWATAFAFGRARWRGGAPWALAWFLATFLPLAGAYAWTLGKISRRNSASALLGDATASEPLLVPAAPIAVERSAPNPGASGLPALPKRVDLLPRQYAGMEQYAKQPAVAAALAVVSEVAQETRFWLLPLALAGLSMRGPERFRWRRGTLAVWAWLGAAAMLGLLQMKAGYIASRYLLPVMPFLGMAAARGAFALTARLAAWPHRTPARLLAAAYVAGMAITVGPALVEPLHKSRRGSVAAAQWLAAHLAPGEAVFDPTEATAFLAGAPCWRPRTGAETELPRFAVIEEERVYRIEPADHALVKRYCDAGRPVMEFKSAEGARARAVYVYELPAIAARPAAAPR